MDNKKLQAVFVAVRDAQGLQAALAVRAALEIAWHEWKPQHEVEYGTVVSEWLLSDSREVAHV